MPTLQRQAERRQSQPRLLRTTPPHAAAPRKSERSDGPGSPAESTTRSEGAREGSRSDLLRGQEDRGEPTRRSMEVGRTTEARPHQHNGLRHQLHQRPEEEVRRPRDVRAALADRQLQSHDQERQRCGLQRGHSSTILGETVGEYPPTRPEGPSQGREIHRRGGPRVRETPSRHAPKQREAGAAGRERRKARFQTDMEAMVQGDPSGRGIQPRTRRSGRRRRRRRSRRGCRRRRFWRRRRRRC